MTPESITVDLDHAKKLKEAGWPQEKALFSWLISKFDDKDVRLYSYDYMRTKNISTPHIFAAPTFEEIINSLRDPEDFMLNNIQIGGKWYQQHIHWDYFSLIGLEDENDVHKEFPRHAGHETWADLAAEYWIYLKENNLLPSS